MQYFHGLSSQPNRNYTCTAPPVRYCVNSTRYFYLHFTAKKASTSQVTVEIVAKARQKASQRSSSMMEVLVGGLASLLFVGFSCFVFGARSKNPCLCLRKLFGKFDACRPCVDRMDNHGCVSLPDKCISWQDIKVLLTVGLLCSPGNRQWATRDDNRHTGRTDRNMTAPDLI
ncbi:uncharacterized protein [Argopecten irradians]|uniref:uncharacterized protein n=1 Tax=Argopecten irradians TaxID=31199 RepID=UPI00371DC11C